MAAERLRLWREDCPQASTLVVARALRETTEGTQVGRWPLSAAAQQRGPIHSLSVSHSRCSLDVHSPPSIATSHLDHSLSTATHHLLTTIAFQLTLYSYLYTHPFPFFPSLSFPIPSPPCRTCVVR